MFRDMKLRQKMTLLFSVIFIVIFSVIFFVITTTITTKLKNSTFENTKNLAYKYSTSISAVFESTMGSIKALATSFLCYEDVNPNDRRSLYRLLMSKSLESNDKFLSVWTIWERDAIDGMDNRFINRVGSNEVGRFVATYYRNDNKILEQIENEESISTGDYYLIPKNTKKLFISEPYYYSYTDDDKNPFYETTVAMPLLGNGKFIGVVGADINSSVYQKIVSEIKPFETGYSMLLSKDSTIIYHPDKDNIGKKI